MPNNAPEMPSDGLVQVTLAINVDIWRRITSEASKHQCSRGVIIAAAMDAYADHVEWPHD